jgi:NitT/TauT family transport system permease protein
MLCSGLNGAVGVQGRIKRIAPPILTIGGLIVLLQFLISAFRIPEIFIPLPSAVISLLLNSKIPWLMHTEVTLYEATGGFLLAILFGIPVAIVLNLSRSLRTLVEPLLLAAQVAPKVALVPILFLWLGFSPLPRIITVFLVCFFPIVIDTETGLASVNNDMIDLVRLYTPSRLKLVSKVSFPTALPSVFSGLKIAVTLAVVGAVIAEFVSSSSGLGYLILSAEANVNTTLAFASIGVLIFLSLLMYGAVMLAEWLAVSRRR